MGEETIQGSEGMGGIEVASLTIGWHDFVLQILIKLLNLSFNT